MSENKKRMQMSDGRSYENKRSEYKKNSNGTTETAIVNRKYGKERTGIAKVNGKQSKDRTERVYGKQG
jgi:hypothetical protein